MTSVVGEKGGSRDIRHCKVNNDYSIAYHHVCESSYEKYICRGVVRCVSTISTDSAP